MFAKKDAEMVEELSDEQLARVTGGSGLLSNVGNPLSTVTQTVQTVTGLTNSLGVSAPHVSTGAGVNAQLGPANVSLGLSTNI